MYKIDCGNQTSTRDSLEEAILQAHRYVHLTPADMARAYETLSCGKKEFQYAYGFIVCAITKID